MPLDGTYYVPANDPTLNTLIEMRYLIARGWCRLAMRRNGDRYCLIGAHKAASKDYTIENNAIKELSRTLYGYSMGNLVSMFRLMFWNDKSCRRQSDVLDLLDRAIERRRNSILKAVERGKIPA